MWSLAKCKAELAEFLDTTQPNAQSHVPSPPHAHAAIADVPFTTSLPAAAAPPSLSSSSSSSLSTSSSASASPPSLPSPSPLVVSVQKKKPAKTFPFALDPFQRHAIACLEQSHSVLVSAHTSAGKTVVAEYNLLMM